MLNAALAALALTAAPPLVTAEGVALDDKGNKPSSTPFLGVQVDVGAPDGIGASLVVTPWRYLRLSVGGLSNGVGAGARAGLTLVAFPNSAFRPLLGVDGGYVFGGQAAWLPGLISDANLRNVISGVSVGFGNAHVGFELGSKYVAFTLRAGLSYVDLTMGSQSLPAGDNASISANGISLKGVIPSARLGFIICFG